MRSALVSLSLFAAFTGQALAGVFITSPTASTTANGGQAFNVVWMDDGKAPSLAAIGPSDFSIYVGNVQQQTQLQQLGTADVSKQISLNATINAGLGPNSNAYFIRVTSASLKDNTTGFPYEAFSAKFTLNRMTGGFDAAVQAQINGASSLGTVGGAATSTAASSTSSSSSPSTTSVTKAASSSTSPTASAATPAKSNAAISMSCNVVLLGATIVLTALML